MKSNIKAVRSLSEPLQLGMDNGARRVLIPLENKRNFFDVSGDVLERVDSVFYGDPQTAADQPIRSIDSNQLKAHVKQIFNIKDYLNTLKLIE